MKLDNCHFCENSFYLQLIILLSCNGTKSNPKYLSNAIYVKLLFNNSNIERKYEVSSRFECSRAAEKVIVFDVLY